MRFRGRSIWLYNTPQSHLEYSASYARLAISRWAGFKNAEDYDALEHAAKVRLTAEYETAMQIQAVLTADAERERREKTPNV